VSDTSSTQDRGVAGTFHVTPSDLATDDAPRVDDGGILAHRERAAQTAAAG
jgi:hypothetical protein